MELYNETLKTFILTKDERDSITDTISIIENMLREAKDDLIEVQGSLDVLDFEATLETLKALETEKCVIQNDFTEMI